MDRFGERLRLGTRAAFSACLLLLAACAVAARASDIDDTTAAAASASGAAAGDNGAQSAARSRPRLQLNQDSFFVEAVLLGFIAVYAFNVVRGLRANKRIGTAFAAKFTGEGSLLASQFSIVGQGEASAPDALQAESPSDYSVYATGRRYVSGLQIKLALKRRPDLLSYIWGMFVAQRDVGEISIYMNAPSWPPMTIAVGHAKPMKALTDAAKDVEKYASAPMGIAKERLPGWPTKAPALVAAAECSAVFYEIFGDAKMQALFSEAGLQGPLRHLRTLSISSDSEEGPQPRVIRCAPASVMLCWFCCGYRAALHSCVCRSFIERCIHLSIYRYCWLFLCIAIIPEAQRRCINCAIQPCLCLPRSTQPTAALLARR